MSARKKESQINLLPQRGFEQTTTGRILTWILSSFRIIVIVTEIIVMIAFLSRFFLDAQNTDLSEEMQTKQAVLTASQEFDKEFKDTQKRVRIFSNLTSSEKFVSNSLTTLRSYLPEDLFLTLITFSKDTLSFEGLSPSEKSIQQLMVNLDASGAFENITLVELKTNQNNSTLLQFNIDAKLAQKGSQQ